MTSCLSDWLVDRLVGWSVERQTGSTHVFCRCIPEAYNSCHHPIFPSHTAGTLYRTVRLFRRSVGLPSNSGI